MYGYMGYRVQLVSHHNYGKLDLYRGLQGFETLKHLRLWKLVAQAVGASASTVTAASSVHGK